MTPHQNLQIAPGATVVVRDEEWLVRAVTPTRADGKRVEVRGTSELVRDQTATFFTSLDTIEVLDPTATQLTLDASPHFVQSRLWLEALLRESPVPMSDTRIVAGHQALLDRMPFQMRPAHLALTNPHPRLLIADAVGLGKTLEIGMILSELIKRGRGERILVVTPRAVLEQFQHEMWTKFAIPLVRLDSEGIQRVRQTLPASRNPFSYFRRVIISIDTLKNPMRYRHHLKAQRWDAVVMDECHNLINPGTQNYELAKLLAAQTDALLLASATPHNGKPESFAELINLLDPTAIKDTSNYTADEIASLYVRRHRNSEEVKDEVGNNWAKRLEPRIVPVPATPAEEAVLAELQHTWLRPEPGNAVVDAKRRLFPWTLLKAFLSSPVALHESIERRRRNLLGASSLSSSPPDAAAIHATARDGASQISASTSHPLPATTDPTTNSELVALDTLDALTLTALDAGPAKLDALIAQLRAMGIGPRSATRVVIFSERIATLTWLESELATRLKLKPTHIRRLHAQLPDAEVQGIVESFGLANSPLRVLLASDMASEGLNLHLQCSRLIHFDLPWSFIRIQQRNGRIDRYLQTESPQITALALTSTDTDINSDLRVVVKLVQKEQQANDALGDAAVLLQLHNEDAEEETVMRALLEQRDLDDIVPDVNDIDPYSFDAIFATNGQHDDTLAPQTAESPTLFIDDDDFLYAAISDLFPNDASLDLHRDAELDLIAFNTPTDLIAMLRDLPASYLKDQKVATRIKLTGSPTLAKQRLAVAKNSGDTLWPDVHYLTPTHPVLSWASSRLLARIGRNRAPVVTADVPAPVFLTQALWSNAHGQAAVTHWGAITGLTEGTPHVADMVTALKAAGITDTAVNAGTDVDLETLQALVPAAVRAAADDLRSRRDTLTGPLASMVAEEKARVHEWSLFNFEDLAQGPAYRRGKRFRDTADTSAQATDYLESLLPVGDPFVRVVGVIAPVREG